MVRRGQVGGQARLGGLAAVSEREVGRDGRLRGTQVKVSAGGSMAVLMPGEVCSYKE